MGCDCLLQCPQWRAVGTGAWEGAWAGRPHAPALAHNAGGATSPFRWTWRLAPPSPARLASTRAPSARPHRVMGAAPTPSGAPPPTMSVVLAAIAERAGGMAAADLPSTYTS